MCTHLQYLFLGSRHGGRQISTACHSDFVMRRFFVDSLRSPDTIHHTCQTTTGTTKTQELPTLYPLYTYNTTTTPNLRLYLVLRMYPGINEYVCRRCMLFIYSLFSFLLVSIAGLPLPVAAYFVVLFRRPWAVSIGTPPAGLSTSSLSCNTAGVRDHPGRDFAPGAQVYTRNPEGPPERKGKGGRSRRTAANDHGMER